MCLGIVLDGFPQIVISLCWCICIFSSFLFALKWDGFISETAHFGTVRCDAGSAAFPVRLVVEGAASSSLILTQVRLTVSNLLVSSSRRVRKACILATCLLLFVLGCICKFIEARDNLVLWGLRDASTSLPGDELGA